MSARLISAMAGQHELQDDLESSIYVLLWMALMYSECSNKSQVPSFMECVIDPPPRGTTGGFAKADFLKGRTFLKNVKFPHRPNLNKLVDQLAQLFSARYDKPDSADELHTAKLRELSTRDPTFTSIYKSSRYFQYQERISLLASPAGTISLFNDALRDRSQWPDDPAVKQDIFEKTLSPLLAIKTGWRTSLEAGIDDCHEAVQLDAEEEGGYERSD